MKGKILLILGVLLLWAGLATSQAWAADGTGSTLNQGLIAIGMGLAVGLSALGTGWAQSESVRQVSASLRKSPKRWAWP